MNNFKSYLQEKRSHPDQNPRLNPYDILEKYKSREDIFVTYTILNKVGINPQSNFNTPNGVYAYPIKQLWKEFDHDTKSVETWSDLFGTDRRYVNVLKRTTGGGKHINDLSNQSEYTKRDYSDDLEKLKKLYKITPQIFDMLVSNAEANALNNSTGGKFWAVTRELALEEDRYNPTNVWTRILRSLGYASICDRGAGIIYEAEPSSCVFLNNKAWEVVETIDRRADLSDHLTPKGDKEPGKLRQSGADKNTRVRDSHIPFDGGVYEYMVNYIENDNATQLRLSNKQQLLVQPGTVIRFVPNSKLIRSKPKVEELMKLLTKYRFKPRHNNLLRALRANNWVFYHILINIDKLIKMDKTIMKNLMWRMARTYSFDKRIKRDDPKLYVFIKKYLYTTDMWKEIYDQNKEEYA